MLRRLNNSSSSAAVALGLFSNQVVDAASSCSGLHHPSNLGAGALSTSKRGRFYRPLVNQGINLWRSRMGRLHKGWEMHSYRHSRPDERPYPEPSINNYYGKARLMWNPIAGKIGVINKKHEDFGWPERRPPPSGLRASPEFFPYFFEKYFPSAEVVLVIDSVLNNETTRPVFQIPQDMSREELVNYLRNIYQIDNIVEISVRNMRGKRYKNEVGTIKQLPDVKIATVSLDAPIVIDFKQIKGTEETPDNKPQLNN